MTCFPQLPSTTLLAYHSTLTIRYLEEPPLRPYPRAYYSLRLPQERSEQARQAGAAVAAAGFLGQHATPAAAAREAAAAAAMATKLERLVARSPAQPRSPVRSRAAQIAISRALAKGDAAAAARGTAAVPPGGATSGAPPLCGMTRDFARTFARRASPAAPGTMTLARTSTLALP